MKNAVILFLVVMSVVRSNVFAAQLRGTVVHREALASEFKPVCTKPTCENINYDNTDPLYLEQKTLRGVCRLYKEILSHDPVVISIVDEVKNCHCECKF